MKRRTIPAKKLSDKGTPNWGIPICSQALIGREGKESKVLDL
jgi:hypothetical protein